MINTHKIHCFKAEAEKQAEFKRGPGEARVGNPAGRRRLSQRGRPSCHSGRCCPPRCAGSPQRRSSLGSVSRQQVFLDIWICQGLVWVLPSSISFLPVRSTLRHIVYFASRNKSLMIVWVVNEVIIIWCGHLLFWRVDDVLAIYGCRKNHVWNNYRVE